MLLLLRKIETKNGYPKIIEKYLPESLHDPSPSWLISSSLAVPWISGSFSFEFKPMKSLTIFQRQKEKVTSFFTKSSTEETRKKKDMCYTVISVSDKFSEILTV